MQPNSNSDSITKYKIEGLLPTNAWTEVCDGSSVSVVSSNQCLIAMSTFWNATTFNKTLGDLV